MKAFLQLTHMLVFVMGFPTGWRYYTVTWWLNTRQNTATLLLMYTKLETAFQKGRKNGCLLLLARARQYVLTVSDLWDQHDRIAQDPFPIQTIDNTVHEDESASWYDE